MGTSLCQRTKSCLLVLFLFFCLPQGLTAQDNPDDLFDEMMQDGDVDEAEAVEHIYEFLREHADPLRPRQPLNLNAATLDELLALPFLTDEQAEDIFVYIDRYEQMHSMAELMMIPSLSAQEREWIRSCCVLGAPDRGRRWQTQDGASGWADSLQRPKTRYVAMKKSQYAAFVAVPFYRRNGFRGEEPEYHGNQLKHWMRLTYAFSPHVSVGAVASQDAGEPFFKGRNKAGYDLYSGYLMVSNVQLARQLKLRSMVVGRYRLRAGLGLVLNTSCGFGKLSSLPSLNSALASPSAVAASFPTEVSLSPSASRTLGRSLQGVASTIDCGRHLRATWFASWQTIDATLTNDGLGIRTLLKTGYHRTASEMARKNNAEQLSAGGNVSFNHGPWHVGVTGVYNRYSKPLLPVDWPVTSESQYYRAIYPQGNVFWNVGVDYGYRLGRRVSVHGEIATGDCGQLATINAFSLRVDKSLALSVLQRYYPSRFYSTMGRSFSDGGANQNESGVYVGGKWIPATRWSMEFYADAAYFPWPKYQAFGSTHSFDNLFQLTYEASARSKLRLRYRLRHREYDADKKEEGYVVGALEYKRHHHLRLTYDYRWNNWKLRSQGDFVYCRYHSSDMGAMFSQQAGYKWRRVESTVGASFFSVSDYNARVYAYEPSTPYNFSVPTFFGRGVHGFGYVQYNPSARLHLLAKIAFTRYFDRDSIGSSHQLIPHPWKADLDVMLRLEL